MNELEREWKKEEKALFQGWDFSHLAGRMITPRLPWDYAKTAKRLMQNSNSVLDVGTGGGEVFSSLAPFPKHAVACEGHEPNVPIARERLEPLGVKVVACGSSTRLPFKNGEFDLVLNRHDALNALEVYRILKNGGIFFTQQVTNSEGVRDLTTEFKAKRKFANITLEEYEKQLETAGFTVIQSRKWTGKELFKDVGAIVYYLKAIPWAVPGFSVKNKLSELRRLQKKLEREGKLEFEHARFMILARKPAGLP